jgi:hypothetical protein
MNETDIETKKGSSLKWLWLIVVAVLVVVVFMWWSGELGNVIGANNAYQAVFLTNDQVYFGKLSKADSQYPVLRDVYYLQVSQGLQPKGQDAPSTNINLVKLGGELHGPQDEMVINRNHILFYENLKSDSQIVTAIQQFKGEGQ